MYTSGWQSVLHKDKDSLLWAQLDPLSHHIDKLANGEISRDKVPAEAKGISMLGSNKNIGKYKMVFHPNML